MILLRNLPGVVGSNPTGRTRNNINKKEYCPVCGPLGQLAEQMNVNHYGVQKEVFADLTSQSLLMKKCISKVFNLIVLIFHGGSICRKILCVNEI